MKKIIVFIISLLLVNVVFAGGDYERKEGNCNKGNVKYYKDLLKDGTMFKGKKVIKKATFKVAVANLEKYCNKEDKTASTPIFINHVIDVAFRQIDGIKGLAYGAPLDSLGKQYREKLNEIEKKYETDPKDIAKLFKKSFGTAEQNMEANNKTLAGKYMLVCEEMLSMSDQLLSANSQDNKVNPMPNSYLRDSCYNRAQKRYEKEMKLMGKVSKQNYYHRIQKKLFKKFKKYVEKSGKMLHSFSKILGNLEYMARRLYPQHDVK